MKDIILVRHGETEWNVTEIFRGRINIGLSTRGERQVELLATRLSTIKVDAVYSSPLWRAFRTAEAIDTYHNVGVNIDDGLNDIDFGEWQGLSLEEVREKYKELYAEWISHPGEVRMPGGESLEAVRERALAVVANVTIQYNGTVVLVSHRVVNKVLICALLGLDNSHFWNIRQDVCGITAFTFDEGRFILNQHNETSFLKPLHQAPLGDF